MPMPDELSEAEFRSLTADCAARPLAGAGAEAPWTRSPRNRCWRPSARCGRDVRCRSPPPRQTRTEPDDADPAEHRLTAPADGEPAPKGLDFARDRFAMNIHGDDSHLDALCHVIYDGTLHGGIPAADALSPEGASVLSVELARDGIVGRGVLLDIPRVHGLSWLEPGSNVTAEETPAPPRPGRGYGSAAATSCSYGSDTAGARSWSWDVAAARAGLHPDRDGVRGRPGGGGARQRQQQRHGSERGARGRVPGACARRPRHGAASADYLRFEDLAPICAREGRWLFLRDRPAPAARGHRLLVNPLAIL